MDTGTILAILGGLAFSRFVLYQKNRLLGNIGYIACGFSLLVTSTDNSSTSIGLIIVLGGFVMGAYDSFQTITKKKKKRNRK